MRKLRVLLADDHQGTVAMLDLLLQALGHETRTATNGQAAINIAAEFRPDVAVLDLGMPKLSGYHVAQYLRLQPWGETLVLIAFSGWAREEDRQRAREVGFEHYLIKGSAGIAELQQILCGVPAMRESLDNGSDRPGNAA